MADAFHTVIPSFSKAYLHQPRFWTSEQATSALNMRGMLLPKDIQYPLADTSIRSIAIVTSPAHFHIVDFHVSQSFPLLEL